jgi:hypothetical protein
MGVLGGALASLLIILIAVYKNSVYTEIRFILREYVMTQPRSQLICASTTSHYHCICRCVRRAYLCGEDSLTGKDYSHRKGWVLARLALLAEVFTIELCAYAVMANHYHLVIHINQDKALALSDAEVISRWGRLFVVPVVVERWRQGSAEDGEIKVVKTLVALWRKRLADVSWYMRCLNEYIARQANLEDECKGRFWEGRFKSQAILDELGLLACMVYVDLNPLRAELVSVPEASADVSIHQRLAESATMAHRVEQSKSNLPWLLPFAKTSSESECLPYTLKDYLQLLDWAGRAQHKDKRGIISAEIPPTLSRLGVDSGSFLSELAGKQLSRGTVIGRATGAAAHAMATGRRYVRGILLTPPSLP